MNYGSRLRGLSGKVELITDYKLHAQRIDGCFDIICLLSAEEQCRTMELQFCKGCLLV